MGLNSKAKKGEGQIYPRETFFKNEEAERGEGLNEKDSMRSKAYSFASQEEWIARTIENHFLGK
ncbi:MAG: hypothetical protein D6805_09260 [Planctomycetota bacterium]|nr:MAG: hypothetical protein D6805_09260 [Planctomycetota bacterium]